MRERWQQAEKNETDRKTEKNPINNNHSDNCWTD